MFCVVVLKKKNCRYCNQNQTQENLTQPKLYSKFQPLKFLKFFYTSIPQSEKVAKDFSSQMLSPGFFMVHDSTTGCEDNETATNQIKLWKHHIVLGQTDETNIKGASLQFLF